MSWKVYTPKGDFLFTVTDFSSAVAIKFVFQRFHVPKKNLRCTLGDELYKIHLFTVKPPKEIAVIKWVLNEIKDI